jgi:cell wall-associated NlpC family hydrolase
MLKIKNLFLVVVLSLSQTAFAADFSLFGLNDETENTSNEAPADTAAVARSTNSWSATAQEIILSALSQTGVKYKYGGNSPEGGFDCSGFVRYVFQQAANLTLPHGARAISQLGQTVTQRELKPGDLVFFNTVRSTFSHVGIYIGNNRFIHSPSAGSAISVTDMGDSYWAKRFTGARRLDAKELASLEANGAKSMK